MCAKNKVLSRGEEKAERDVTHSRTADAPDVLNVNLKPRVRECTHGTPRAVFVCVVIYTPVAAAVTAAASGDFGRCLFKFCDTTEAQHYRNKLVNGKRRKNSAG